LSFGAYIKSRIGEFLLLLLSVWSLAVVGFNAFYLDGIVEVAGYGARAGLALAACAVLLCVLYITAWRANRLSGLVAGAAVYVVLVALCVVAALVLSVGEYPYEDAEGNYLYLVLVLVAATTGGFLLTRTLLGSALWFLACAFSCTLVQAFYESGELVMSAAAALCALALIIHRNFKLGQKGADVVQKPSATSGFMASITPVLAAGALALVAWFAIIAPLDPSVFKLTLITDYRSRPIEEYKGTADEQPDFNYELTSDKLVDGFDYTTDDLKEDPTAIKVIDAASLLEQQLQQQVEQSAAAGSGAHESFDAESDEAEFDPLAWSEVFPVVILAILFVLLAILAIVAYFVGRRLWRGRRLRRLLDSSPRTQVASLYLFALSRLARLGFKVPLGMTLGEYATTSARKMDMLTEETRVSFAKLTATYEACVYGRREPTEDEVVPFVAFYLSFWKAARTHLGTFKYFFKSFRL
jgi:hypothetical protein